MGALKKPQVMDEAGRYVTIVGIVLPPAYILPNLLARVSSVIGRLDVLAWVSDAALLLSPPWLVLGIILVIIRARDLPQRFWIAFCVNGFLAYTSLPIYLMHFGVYR